MGALLALGCAPPTVQREVVGGRCQTPGDRVLLYVHGEGDTDDALCDSRISSLIYRKFRYVPTNVGYSFNEATLREFFDANRYGYLMSFDDYLQRKSRPYTPQNLRYLRALGVRRTPAYIVLNCQGEELARYTGPAADESPAEFPQQFYRFLTLLSGER
jgi:hypothetical protein